MSGRPVQCTLAPPPPRRVYCTPAAYTSPVGAKYHNIMAAYGSSATVGQ